MKKQLLIVLSIIVVCGLLISCGQSSGGSDGGEENSSPDKETYTAASDSSEAEDTANEEESEAPAKDDLIEDFEFTKSVFNQTLEKPITVCGLQFDESTDRQFEEALDQGRDSFHLHISILEVGYDMDTHLQKCQSDNAEYVTSVARGYNVQQADAANADGSAKFTVIRYTNFEDGGENDYQYMGDLVYTDGTSVAATEFLYSVDREYGNGEEVEAIMKAITGYYGIDYDNLNWVDAD